MSDLALQFKFKVGDWVMPAKPEFDYFVPTGRVIECDPICKDFPAERYYLVEGNTAYIEESFLTLRNPNNLHVVADSEPAQDEWEGLLKTLPREVPEPLNLFKWLKVVMP